MANKRMIVREFGGREVLELQEDARLPEPGQGEVRVRVLASGVAFTDVMIRKGKYPGLKQKPPFSPGYDMVGIVDATGPGVKHFQPGQKVADLTVTGAHAEYLCLPEARLTPVPEALDPVKAAGLILTYVTAFQLLHRVAGTKGRRRVLVHGAGGAVGSALVELARLAGMEAYGTASTPKHGTVRKCGGIPIDYREEDFVTRLQNLDDPGVDAAFDCIGGQCLNRSFQTLREKGILVSFGFYNAVLGRGRSIPLDFTKLFLWNLLPNRRRARFYSIGKMRRKHPQWFVRDLQHVFNLALQERVEPVVARTVSLEEIPWAHEQIEEGKVEGKLVVKM